jgi:dihydrofolate synthase/folylpolyglutamate synthase
LSQGAPPRSPSAPVGLPPEKAPGPELSETGPFSPPADGPRRASIGEALAWLDRHINLEAIEAGKAGSHGAPSLERIGAMTDAMGSPQLAYPVVHITGTNGKGSTSRMVSALLRAVGVNTGTYTSPHLEMLNERLVIGDEPIGDEELAAQLAALAELENFLGIQPTWFELMTAAAFRWFADEAVEAGVIEVGLGGRYDATNVAEAAVAVVTNVDLDHTELLGDSRELIAAEKAGIIKPGSVVVLGERDEKIAAIFEEEARRVGAAAVWRRGPDFSARNVRVAVGGRVSDLATPATTYEEVFLPLRGSYQCDNAALALAAAQAFVGDVLPDDVVREGLAAVRVPGRMEVVSRRPLVVLDGAHNPAGAAAAGEALGEDFSSAEGIVIVMGCLRNRSTAEVLDGLADDRVKCVIGCPPPSPRAQPAAAVTEAARAAGFVAKEAADVSEALEQAVELAGEDDLVLVTGSLYVVGAARRLLSTRVG